MKITLLALTLVAASLGSQSGAQQISKCDARAQAANIAEPWSANSRSFADGDVRLTVLETPGSETAAFRILILTPPRNALGERLCRIISYQREAGFFGVTLSWMGTSYDPLYGLVFDIPVQIFVASTGKNKPARLHLTVDRSIGAIGAGLR
ncbi:MAG: hypothetical protein GXP05_04810 [Alphaproteobacteria bacterium]|nr:hypothetical protein [Alphaproteobacteria bacterium]